VLAVLLSLGPAALPAHAAGVVLPTAPSGFSGQPGEPGEPGGFPGNPSGLAAGAWAGEEILDGFSFDSSLTGTYDSNVTRSPGPPYAPTQSDFILGLGGNLKYLSKSPNWTFGGNYRGSYNQYFEQTDFSGYSQGTGVVVNYDSPKISAALTAGIAYDQGSNTYYNSSFVQLTTVNSALSVRYRFSPKTFLAGNASQSFITASGGNYVDTKAYDLGLAALWKYSPLTELGPGIRYTYREGNPQTGRSTIGPTLSLNYKLSKKVTMNSRVGMDFVSYETGGSADPTLSASIGLNYQASKLWGMNLSLLRDTQANPSLAGAFYEVNALRLGYHRKIRRAILNLGVGYRTYATEIPQNTAGYSTPDRDYFNIDASLGMPVFANTTQARVFVSYRDQNSDAQNSWDAVRFGLGISRSF